MCILSYIYGSHSLEFGEDIELFYVVQDFCLVTVVSSKWAILTKRFVMAYDKKICLLVQQLVFAGPVHWTGKKTEIELNPTAKDRTTACSCTNSEFFRLPVARFVEKSKNQKKTGLDRLQPVFRPVMCWTLLTHIFP